jgi:hypothetical protein
MRARHLALLFAALRPERDLIAATLARPLTHTPSIECRPFAALHIFQHLTIVTFAAMHVQLQWGGVVVCGVVLVVACHSLAIDCRPDPQYTATRPTRWWECTVQSHEVDSKVVC